jgi:predicted amidohydrolase YtcJ
MQEFNKGYPIWNWLQFQVNIPNTYKDLKAGYASVSGNRDIADMIVYNAAITTQNDSMPSAEAVAIKNGLIAAVGTNDNIMKWKGDNTKLIDAGKRRLIPGLNDSHSHYLRGGLSFTTELRWDGVPSLKEGVEMIKKQAEITPAGQWVRIVGGFTPWQFEEKRLPTPDELTAVAPNTPVYIQYFYSVIITNKKGLESLHVTRETPAAPGSRIEKDAKGNPTGLFIADPNPALFYGLLGQLPKMDEATAENSTQYMFHELARFGLTSVIDAGGGGFNYPGDYKPPVTTVKEDKLPLRVSFFLFTQHPGKELDDYQNWIKENTIGANLDESREHGFELGGAGEWVLWKAGDFENFRSPRPTQDSDMEAKLEPVISLFVQKRWPFRIHATYDESINRLLNVIEKVNQKTPLNGLRWSIEHGETLKEKNIDRIKTLGGGVAIQDRMFFLGDDFVKRYGAEVAATAPPVRLLLQKGIPVGMGTDGTRSSFNPWLGLYFLTTGKVASGKKVLGKDNILSREEALKLYSWGSAWFSQEETVKGKIKQGQYADFALLSKDYFQVREEEIKSIESVLTVVDGKPVYGTGDFKNYSPVLPPILPAWSPLRSFGSFYIKKRN